MSRKKKTKTFEKVLIERFAGEGRCVSRIDDTVVFVEGVAPGDVVDIKTVEIKKNYMVAVPTYFHERSADYTEPFCSHFGVCGGCKWQNLRYEKQLDYKQQQVTETLQRIGKIRVGEILPIIGAVQNRYYRNKMEYTFTDARWLTAEELASDQTFDRRGVGFHIPKQFDKVLDIQTCYLQDDLSNQIRNALRTFAIENNLSFFNLKEKTGFLRGVVIRNTSLGEWLVLLQFGEDNSSAIKLTMQFLADTFPMITSLNYVINTKLNDSYTDLPVFTFQGTPYITERMENLQFRIGVKSFYQTNSAQAYNLYKVARDMARLTGKETVYDLYTGTGTIALFIASFAQKVVGIEYVPEAIEDAKINAMVNQITNVVFYAGDMKDIFTDTFIKENGSPDVIITAPPRTGMHPDVVSTLLRLACPRIVYVSCNPATQARDLQMLASLYDVVQTCAVDMFPHTYHVENVALLEKKNI